MNLLVYGLVALAVLGMVGTGVYKVKQWGADEVRAEWAEDVKQAKERADKEREQRNTVTEKREAEHATAFADLSDKYRAALLGLRDKPSDGKPQPLSSAAGLLSCPDRQADVARGLERLEERVLGLLERGDKAINRTILCKNWIEDQRKVEPEVF